MCAVLLPIFEYFGYQYSIGKITCMTTFILSEV
jgi:hypothetical protein